MSTDAVKVRQKAYNARKVDKYDDYHLEAARRNALFLHVIVDSNGSFTPTDKLFNPGITNRRPPRGAGIDPRLGLRAVFENGVVRAGWATGSLY